MCQTQQRQSLTANQINKVICSSSHIILIHRPDLNHSDSMHSAANEIQSNELTFVFFLTHFTNTIPAKALLLFTVSVGVVWKASDWQTTRVANMNFLDYISIVWHMVKKWQQELNKKKRVYSLAVVVVVGRIIILSQMYRSMRSR